MKITKTMYGNSFSREELYAYNTNLIANTQKKSNSSPWLKEAYRYDSYGNVTSKSLSGLGITMCTIFFSTLIYDLKKRNPHKH